MLVWTASARYPPTGDEPHYLVMADGLLRDHTFDQTQAYRREFRNRDISPAGLAQRGASPSPKNTHARSGVHGLYNVHGVGLPILLALPFAVAGVAGAKFFLLLLVSLLVPLTWHIAGQLTKNRAHRILSTAVVVLAAPFIPAAGQIYPGLIAGIGALSVIASLLGWKRGHPDNRAGTTPPQARMTLGLALICYALPWLHIKFTIIAVILGAAMAIRAYRVYRSTVRALAILTGLLVSLVMLAAYNIHAFGRPQGPYIGPALIVSWQSLVVLVGLHLDRFQGLFIQNPAYFLGLAALVPFLREHFRAGIVVALCYLSFIIPNALHPNWYGGDSFAGRFAWSAAVVALPIVVFAIVTILKDLRRGWCLTVVMMLINAATYYSYTFGSLVLPSGALASHNSRAYSPLTYGSFHAVLNDYLPLLHDKGQAIRHGPNACFLILAIGLLVSGGSYGRRHRSVFYNNITRFLVTSAVFIVVVGAMTRDVAAGRHDPQWTGGHPLTMRSHTGAPLVWAGASLPSEIGNVSGTSRVVRANEARTGFATFGPYTILNAGRYRFVIALDAFGKEDQDVAWVDVFLASKKRTLLRVAVKPSSRRQDVTGTFDISAETPADPVEVRTYYLGTGDLAVHSLTLERIADGGGSRSQRD
ncbi:MAG: hypothetical protein ACE5IK_03460 [Acidobacteriota bacterium]